MNLYPLSLVRGAGHSLNDHPTAARLVGFKVRGTFHAVYDIEARKMTAWPIHWHRLNRESVEAHRSLREAVAFFETHCGLDLSASDHSTRRDESGFCA